MLQQDFHTPGIAFVSKRRRGPFRLARWRVIRRPEQLPAVFLNSTVGRLQLMRNPGRSLDFPNYSAEEAGNLRVPDLNDERLVRILADCWERTSMIKVPQYRDGDCEVRRFWDESAAKVTGRDSEEFAELRFLLHWEPHVRGIGYNQFGGE